MKSKFVTVGYPELGYFVDGGGSYVAGCMSVCRSSGSAPLPATRRVLPEQHTPAASSRPPRRRRQRRRSWRIRPGARTRSWWTPCGSGSPGTTSTEPGISPCPWCSTYWAIMDVPSCAAARRDDSAAYACRSAQSVCLESTYGPGYVCNCTVVYEGNPYVINGCTDVDECQHRDQFPCYAVCVNTPGSFTCTCPKSDPAGAPPYQTGAAPTTSSC
ncbi:unnamed protein product [Urochloa humidicola]